MSYSNMPFPLTRDLSGFVSFPLLPNEPPLLSFKNFSSDKFSLYIIMVEVHGSYEAKSDYLKTR